MITGAWMFPLVILGMIDASITRRPVTDDSRYAGALREVGRSVASVTFDSVDPESRVYDRRRVVRRAHLRRPGHVVYGHCVMPDHALPVLVGEIGQVLASGYRSAMKPRSEPAEEAIAVPNRICCLGCEGLTFSLSKSLRRRRRVSPPPGGPARHPGA